MRIGFFSAKPYDIVHFNRTNQQFNVDIEYFDYRLCMQNVKLAEGYEVVCAFVNDSLCEEVLVELAKGGTKVIAMRCAGFNNVDYYRYCPSRSDWNIAFPKCSDVVGKGFFDIGSGCVNNRWRNHWGNCFFKGIVFA